MHQTTDLSLFCLHSARFLEKAVNTQLYSQVPGYQYRGVARGGGGGPMVPVTPPW